MPGLGAEARLIGADGQHRCRDFRLGLFTSKQV